VLKYQVMIERTLTSELQQRLFQGKVLIILGPRQAGKTTLIKKLSSQLRERQLWLNGDDIQTRSSLSNVNASELKPILGKNKIVFIDEAQRIENIGLTLKIMVDNYPEIQVIATGSSSFELADKINEPLTGRKFEYFLYPFSFKELAENSNYLEEKSLLKRRLVFGSYPEVVTKPDDQVRNLKELADSYLFKDILALGNLKKPEKLELLLKALAFQVGQQVSYNELGQITGLDNQTVEKYVLLLERAFIVFRLPSFSKNLRNEIKFSRKIYFYDNGIRNAIINNFNEPEFRNDVGSLWENYLVSERMKRNHAEFYYCNSYFWRNHAQQEIDYLEEAGGQLSAYEFKWNQKKKARLPNQFKQAYPDSKFATITPENYTDFIV
jgi:hypothetical protein